MPYYGVMDNVVYKINYEEDVCVCIRVCVCVCVWERETETE